MRYNDGFVMNEDLRVTECPKCGNEEFSEDADYCRICGTTLYNLCDGEDIYDHTGHLEYHEAHRNHGNARFCEKCGKPTAFFHAKFLRPYSEVKEQYVDQYLQENPGAFSSSKTQLSNDEDDDLPF
ncbi:MAG: hypothetical protein ACOX6G_10920 [Christensenellales bacterium]|jgi:predicted nucleic-acid-binding Zn-ribbon protein